MNPGSAEPFLLEWPKWGTGLSDQPVLLSRLGHGLTNRSYLLDSNLGKLVLRVNHPEGEKLGINRSREAWILNRLEALDGPPIGPEVVHQDAEYRYLVYRYIEGAALSEKDSQTAENLTRVRELVSRYQRLQLDIAPRDYRQYLLNYWQQLENRGLIDTQIRNQWQDFQPTLSKLCGQKDQARLTHHDLIASNLIASPSGLRIIDWEYAHLGHPGLDWACIAQNEPHQDPELTDLIFWLNELWHRVSQLC